MDYALFMDYFDEFVCVSMMTRPISCDNVTVEADKYVLGLWISFSIRLCLGSGN